MVYYMTHWDTIHTYTHTHTHTHIHTQPREELQGAKAPVSSKVARPKEHGFQTHFSSRPLSCILPMMLGLGLTSQSPMLSGILVILCHQELFVPQRLSPYGLCLSSRDHSNKMSFGSKG